MTVLDKIVAAVTPPESQEKRAQARAKARSIAKPGDWFSLILDHHERIEAAFADVRAAAEPAAREAALKKLAMVLNGHSMAEEVTVYPALADAGGLMDADAAYIQQVAAKMQAAALEKLDPSSADFLDKLGHLEGAVQHHVFEEEDHWYPKLAEKASADEQARVTLRYKEEFDRYIRQGPAR
jgi:hemerythrin superfamily protein